MRLTSDGQIGQSPRELALYQNGHVAEARSAYTWQSAEGRTVGQVLVEHGADLAALLDEIDVCAITPLDALNLLFAMQKQRREAKRISRDGDVL